MNQPAVLSSLSSQPGRRDLDRHLITTAYRLLVPYVNACPACTDILFGIIANGAIEEHEEGRAYGQLGGAVMHISHHGPEWEAAEQAHFAKASADTVQLLRQTGEMHEHEPN